MIHDTRELTTSDWAVLVASVFTDTATVDEIAAKAAKLALAVSKAQDLAVENATIKSFTGRVLEVQVPAIAQDGKTLNLGKIVVKPDVGKHPENLWFDLGGDMAAAFEAVGKASIGATVRYTRRNQLVSQNGQTAVDKDGNPVSYPRLVELVPVTGSSIGSPVDAAAVTPDPPTAPTIEPPAAQLATVAQAEASSPTVVRTPQAAKEPFDKTSLLEMGQKLGWTAEEIKSISRNILGEPVVINGKARQRTRAEIAMVWAELLRQADKLGMLGSQPEREPAHSSGNGKILEAVAASSAPKTSAELVVHATDLGWRKDEIKIVAQEILGPPVMRDGKAVERTEGEIAILWAELVRRASGGIPVLSSVA